MFIKKKNVNKMTEIKIATMLKQYLVQHSKIYECSSAENMIEKKKNSGFYFEIRFIYMSYSNLWHTVLLILRTVCHLQGENW